ATGQAGSPRAKPEPGRPSTGSGRGGTGALQRLDPASRPVAWLIACGVASVAVYAGYLTRALWLPDAYPGPFVDTADLLGPNYGGLIGWIACLAIVFALWAASLRAASVLPARRSTLALVLGIAAA